MRLETEHWVIGLIVLMVGGLVALCVWDAKRWGKYANEHHCVEVARAPGDYYPVYYSDGKTTMMYMQYTGDRVTYQCDNGYVTR